MRKNQKILKCCIIALMVGTTATASGASLERLLVTGGIGAGIGQAIGGNTEATLIGAASALLLDGYMNPQPRTSYRNSAPAPYYGRPSAVQYSQPPRYIQQPVVYQRRPDINYGTNSNYDYQSDYNGGEYIETTTTTTTTTTTHGYEPVW